MVLRGEDFEGACFDEGGTFFKSILERANFKNSLLVELEFNEVRLDRSDISESHIEGVSFAESKLAGSTFAHSVLYDVDFSGTNLEGADFRGSVFMGDIDFFGATVTGANFTGVDLGRARNLEYAIGLEKAIVGDIDLLNEWKKRLPPWERPAQPIRNVTIEDGPVEPADRVCKVEEVTILDLSDDDDDDRKGSEHFKKFKREEDKNQGNA
jgi:hypothetical protein